MLYFSRPNRSVVHTHTHTTNRPSYIQVFIHSFWRRSCFSSQCESRVATHDISIESGSGQKEATLHTKVGYYICVSMVSQEGRFKLLKSMEIVSSWPKQVIHGWDTISISDQFEICIIESAWILGKIKVYRCINSILWAWKVNEGSPIFCQISTWKCQVV